MSLLRYAFALAAAAVASLLATGSAQSQTKITIGKFIGGTSLHIPTYVGVSKGFYKEEGLDAQLVSLAGRALVTAGMSGSVDFIPIPSGGAQAALSGAEIRYVVGEALRSHWVIISSAKLNKPEDLKGKTIAYGRPGGADYDEGAAVLLRVFKLDVGKDYKVISFSGEPERIAALANGSIDAALVSVAQVPKALEAGMKVLVRVSAYIDRASGSIWTRKEFSDKNPEVIAKFIRGTAKAVMFLRNDKAGSIPILKEHLGIDNDKDAGTIWDETKDSFAAELPKDLFHEIFESRRISMIDAKQWPKDKPLPDPEQFLLRDLLDSTLKQMGYVPAPPPKK